MLVGSPLCLELNLGNLKQDKLLLGLRF